MHRWLAYLTILGVLVAASPVASAPERGQPARVLYLRNEGIGGGCGNNSTRYLADEPGENPGNGCSTFLGTAQFLLTGWTETYSSRPETVETAKVDATRPLAGTIQIGSLTPNWYVADVTVTINKVVLPTYRIDSKPYTGSYLFGGVTGYPFEVAIPKKLHKKVAKNIIVEIEWLQAVAANGTTWTELDDPTSTITLPTLK